MRRIVKLIDHGSIRLVLLAFVMLTPFSAWAEDYPIMVASVQVTSENATTGIKGDDITGNGSVTYDAENRKLTLNNVEITGFIYSSLAELTIELTGTNTMFGGIQFSGSDDVSEGNLNVTGTGSLEMTGQDGGDVVSYFTDVTIGSGLYLQTNEPGTHWDGQSQSFSASGNVISSLTITPDVYYPIWVISSDGVHYIQVSGENKGHVLGESNTTVTYDSDNDKLILNNFACATTDGEYAICLGEQEEFKIHLLGENTIQGSGVSFAIKGASLVFSTDAQTPGSLTIAGSYSFTSIGDDAVSYNNGLEFSNNSTKKVIAKPYNLWVNGTQVTSANSQDILSDDATYNKNKISFDGDHTLTLHNIPGTVFDTQVPFIKNGIGNLTIFLDGQNEVNCGVFIEKETDGGDNFTATFVTDSNAPGLLAIISNTEEWYTGHTLECTDPLSLNPTGYTYTTAPKALYATTYAEYDLTIAGIPVTSANAGGVTGDGISGTVTYNATDRILTLNSATISTNDNNPSPLIICNGNLTVDLVGPSSIGFNGSYATYAFKNIGSTGELTFTSTSTTSEYGNYLSITSEFYEGTYKGLCDGFTKVNFNNDLGLFNRSRSMMVGTITGEAPGFYIADGFNNWTAENGLLLNATYHYKIDYVDTTIEGNGVEVDLPLDETNHNFSGATLKISDLAGPCTITSYAKMDGTIIGSKKAKLFGFTGTKLKVVYDGSETPESTPIVLSPAIEEDDGIEFQEGADISIVTVNSAGSLTPIACGSENGYFGLTYTGDEHLWSTGKTTILNEDAIVIPVEVVPPAPTIAYSSTTTYLDTDEIEVTAAENMTIFYTWDTSVEVGNSYVNNPQHSDITLSICDEDNPIIAQGGTLRAWAGYSLGDDEYLMSEVATQAFTVKKDIANAYVDGLAESATYTGETIVPTFTLKESEDANAATISADNYDIVYEKYLGETQGYGVVESIVDAGIYMVSVKAKGDTYGGEKYIYEGFAVTQAENSWTTEPTANTLTYTGEAQALLTAGVAKFGDVKYKLGAEGTFTAAIPEETNAGTYTVYYKVDGNENYNGIDASETNMVTVTISPATITDVTLDNTEFTYTGEVQTATISSVKAGEMVLNSEYYVVSGNTGTNKDTYELTVTAKENSNFTGSKTTTFTISAANIAEFYDISLTETSFVYNGAEHKPAVVFKKGDNVVKLTANDYEVTYTNNVNVGSADAGTAAPTATITGKGNYSGTATANFTISRDLGMTFAENQTWASYYATEDLVIPEGLTAYIVSSADKSTGTVTTTQINYIPKNQAVLLNNPNGIIADSFIADPYPESAPGVTGNLLQGSENAINISTITTGTVYILYNNEFRRATSGTIPARRAYLVVSGSAHARLRVTSNGTTDINDSIIEDNSDNWYNLDGRKFDGQPKKPGLYINNGKKVFIKK